MTGGEIDVEKTFKEYMEGKRDTFICMVCKAETDEERDSYPLYPGKCDTCVRDIKYWK